MIITDLDGTLLDSASGLSARNRAALEELGQRGIPRVIATGRSPHSAHAVLPHDFPVDYVIFSTGAGVIDWRSGEIIYRLELDRETFAQARQTLVDAQLDFMVHAQIPENHHFEYERHGTTVNPDFQRRCDRAAEYAAPGDGSSLVGVSQLLAIEPAHVPSQYEDIRRALPDATVVLATSPLDHESRWIEIFPPSAGKGRTAAWLADRLGVPQADTVGIGNDYNDRDLLEWVARPFVVANAPGELRALHEEVASNDRDGFAEAIARHSTAR